MVEQRFGPDKVAPNLIPEFERCVAEAAPKWFLMENVRDAPIASVPGYTVDGLLLNNRWVGGVQSRLRRFSFGVRGQQAISLAAHIDVEALEPLERRPTVLASGGSRQCVPNTEGGRGKYRLRYMGNKSRGALGEAIRLQGLPSDFLDGAPFTVKGKWAAIGNGVPVPMGRAIARAINQALGLEVAP